jgi:cysteinyl-tRNA synthetase
MQIWRSPWGNGNPGWHIECTAMSTKYLGKHFDIHGGGMDLKFPHHEDEIAQSCSSLGCNPAKYWMHANMLNVNGQKMSKSLGNFFLPMEIIAGETALFKKAYSADVIRFFMMQAHYRSTLDFTEDALNAAEKGYERLMESLSLLENVSCNDSSSLEVKKLVDSFYSAMNDDFNAPILIANLFEAVKQINLLTEGKITCTVEDKEELKNQLGGFIFNVLGLKGNRTNSDGKLNPVMDLVLDLRQEARSKKDWSTSDKIRDGLAAAGIEVKDGNNETSWR